MICEIAQVSVKMAAGCNLITASEWLAMPLSERMKFVLDRKVEFLDGDGEAVPLKEALAALNNM